MKYLFSPFLLLVLFCIGSFAQAPTILRFEPKVGTTGTKVLVIGRNLKTTRSVAFGNIAAARFEVINDTALIALVGEGASGQVMVKTDSGSAQLGDFIFIRPVAINCDSIRNFKPIINEIRTETVCFRDSLIKLRVTNGEFRSYIWSTGDTTPFTAISSSQIVFVKVGNSALGCFSQSTAVKFIRNTNRIPEIIYKDSALRARPTATYHRWYFNGQPLSTDSILNTKRIGIYRVETSYDKLCWTSSKEFPFTIGTTVSPQDSLFMKLYPNPTSGEFSVAIVLPSIRTVTIQITITDMAGAVAYKSPKLTITGRELHIPVTINRKGIYRVEAKVNEKIIVRRLFVQ